MYKALLASGCITLLAGLATPSFADHNGSHQNPPGLGRTVTHGASGGSHRNFSHHTTVNTNAGKVGEDHDGVSTGESETDPSDRDPGGSPDNNQAQ